MEQGNLDAYWAKPLIERLREGDELDWCEPGVWRLVNEAADRIEQLEESLLPAKERRRLAFARRDAQIVERIKAGEFLADIAKDFGVTPQAITAIRRAHGLPIRWWGGKRRGPADKHATND